MVGIIEVGRRNLPWGGGNGERNNALMHLLHGCYEHLVLKPILSY